MTMLAVALVSCKDSTSCGKAPGIDGQEAFSLVEKAVSFGTRHSGSDGAAKIAAWIESEAKSCKGCEARIVEFDDNTPAGDLRFRNVEAYFKGADERTFIIVGAHYDSKRLDSIPDFEGANDGGSGVGVLLAMMKTLSRMEAKPPVSLLFVFFDGEECLYSYTEKDGLHGSRHLAKTLEGDGRLSRCRAMILLDMVGDRELCLEAPTNSDSRIVKIALDSAKELGLSGRIKEGDRLIIDDHCPFVERGVPSIDLIDFEFGPGNVYWHSRGDSMDKVSRDSLKASGDIAFGVIWGSACESGLLKGRK